MENTYHFSSGNAPLIISMPHVGTLIPDEIRAGMMPPGLNIADTDWHLPALYNMTQALGISVLSARYSRYVIDLNRPPEDISLYPGLSTTSLCPVDTFASERIYQEGMEPGADEIRSRVNHYWQPYHQKLQDELDRLQRMHGYVVLWDAHSIASQVPRFFDGTLPDLSFGTADGKSCYPGLQQALAEALHDCKEAANYSHVFNQRFKGGYITRHYGQPEQSVHAIQLEMSQCIYMNEQAPYNYNDSLAKKIQPVLLVLLQTCLDWTKQHSEVIKQKSSM